MKIVRDHQNIYIHQSREKESILDIFMRKMNEWGALNVRCNVFLFLNLLLRYVIMFLTRSLAIVFIVIYGTPFLVFILLILKSLLKYFLAEMALNPSQISAVVDLFKTEEEDSDIDDDKVNNWSSFLLHSTNKG